MTHVLFFVIFLPAGLVSRSQSTQDYSWVIIVNVSNQPCNTPSPSWLCPGPESHAWPNRWSETVIASVHLTTTADSSGQVKCNSELTGMSGNSFTVASFPGLPTIQFYSMQKRRWKAWSILSHEWCQCHLRGHLIRWWLCIYHFKVKEQLV